MLKRYSLEIGYCDAYMVQDPNGGFISFEDYEKEKSNGAQPALSEVLAKIEKKAFWDYVPGRAVRVEDVKEILSEYFA